jgi:hypothetical protein
MEETRTQTEVQRCDFPQTLERRALGSHITIEIGEQPLLPAPLTLAPVLVIDGLLSNALGLLQTGIMAWQSPPIRRPPLSLYSPSETTDTSIRIWGPKINDVGVPFLGVPAQRGPDPLSTLIAAATGESSVPRFGPGLSLTAVPLTAHPANRQLRRPLTANFSGGGHQSTPLALKLALMSTFSHSLLSRSRPVTWPRFSVRRPQ